MLKQHLLKHHLLKHHLLLMFLKLQAVLNLQEKGQLLQKLDHLQVLAHLLPLEEGPELKGGERRQHQHNQATPTSLAVASSSHPVATTSQVTTLQISFHHVAML
jgi:hypothetical protein